MRSNLNLLTPIAIIQQNGVSLYRFEQAFVGTGLRRLVLAVPQETYDEGMLDILLFEGNQYLVNHFRHEPRAAAAAAHQGCHGSPIELIFAAHPWEIHADASLPIGVVHVYDSSYFYTFETCHR